MKPRKRCGRSRRHPAVPGGGLRLVPRCRAAGYSPDQNQKLVVGDRTYKQFRRFIDDYVKVASGAYAKAGDLPRESDEVSHVTDIWLKFTDVPEAFDKMLLQVDLYRWEGDHWSDHRVATSDRPVFGGGKLWQHSLSLIAPRGSAWATQIGAKQLPLGKYLAKLYVDQEHALQRDPARELGEEALVGQCEVESGWPAGYGSMTIVPCPSSLPPAVNVE